MLIVQLLGGLGNQLFQYCFGQRLAFEHSLPVFYDSRLLRDHAPGRHSVARNFALDVFEIDVREAPLSRSIRYAADGLPRALRGVLKSVGITRPQLRTLETEFGFDDRKIGTKPPAYFSGLWQSCHYFAPIEQNLRERLQFRFPLPSGSLELASGLESERSVCLHVRRSDYLTQGKDSALGFVGLDYYRNAVKQLLQENDDLHFFVFSDDLSWCKSELDFLKKVRTSFVDNSHAGYKDSGHLQLMSMARYFVVPNSTFSWWAAWLCSREDKKVFLPEKWFRDTSINTSGFYFDGTTAVG